MALGLIGRKCGMTRCFNDEGVSVPVTVVEALPNRVVQVKTAESDGYSALAITTGERKRSRVNKPTTGRFEKASTEPGRGIWEFRLDNDTHEYAAGQAITVELFNEGQPVDVAGTSIGKGFAGSIKRHNFSMQDATHGNSLSHRAPGSIGQNQTPGRVFKGKKMAGHMGNASCTVQNLKVIKIDAERNLLFIKGGVPGSTGRDVCVLPAVKKTS